MQICIIISNAVSFFFLYWLKVLVSDFAQMFTFSETNALCNDRESNGKLSRCLAGL